MSRLLPRPIDTDPALLARGTVLAFDATLTNTGFSVVSNSDEYGIEVLDAGCLRPLSDCTSHEKSFDKGATLLRMLAPVMNDWRCKVDHIVCERPAVAGHRIESALLASFAVHVACGGAEVLVSRTHVLSLLLGPGSHTKAQARATARCWIPDRGSPEHPFNEHIADAELAAVTHLFDLAHGGVS